MLCSTCYNFLSSTIIHLYALKIPMLVIFNHHISNIYCSRWSRNTGTESTTGEADANERKPWGGGEDSARDGRGGKKEANTEPEKGRGGKVGISLQELIGLTQAQGIQIQVILRIEVRNSLHKFLTCNIFLGINLKKKLWAQSNCHVKSDNLISYSWDLIQNTELCSDVRLGIYSRRC